MFEQKREEKEAACNVWAALLDALYEKIEVMDNERKNMRKRLTKSQRELYRSTKAARNRAEVGGERSFTASGEAADSASTSQPPGGAEVTASDAGSVAAFDWELARVRRQIGLAAQASRYYHQKLLDLLRRAPPSPTEDMPSPERKRTGEAQRAWENRRQQLEQDAEQVRKTAAQLCERRQALTSRRAAYVKVHGFPADTTGCENASLRFSAFGITVNEQNVIALVQLDAAVERVPNPKQARVRLDLHEHQSFKTNECTALYMGLTNLSLTVATRWQNLVL
ncbi:UNVERIFIED_CONTAM: hypothetical protein HHA_456970 [Hammondia hammondi]|eukprot:XP_008888998.1 hypothetical protein HHA_456970 [Hammondia hammondi]